MFIIQFDSLIEKIQHEIFYEKLYNRVSMVQHYILLNALTLIDNLFLLITKIKRN